jgi:hypothetical protein
MGGVFGSREEAPLPTTVIDPFEHEQRYILTRAQAIGFYEAVGPRALLELYDAERPICYTRTTYLDTDDFAYFRSCDGPVARRLRIREYASAYAVGETPILSGMCFLELKQSAGTSRSKIRLEAPPAVLQEILDGRRAEGAHVMPADRADEGDGDGMEPLRALEVLRSELAAGRIAPRLSTMYRRTCMTGEGGRVRITLDEGPIFSLPQPIGAAGEPAPARNIVATGPARVLEIKHWGETPDWLARAVDGLSPAPSFSKFRVGMLALKQQGAAPTLPEPIIGAPTLFVLTGSV